MKKQKLSSLLPIAVFLIFYLGLGIWSEYIMKIPMGFYNIYAGDPDGLLPEPFSFL